MKERVILAIAFGFALGTAEAANEVVRPVYEPPCEGGPLERHHSCNQAYNGFIFSTSEGAPRRASISGRDVRTGR